MLQRDDTGFWDDDPDAPEDGAPQEVETPDTEALVTCPHCGETTSISLDPAGGRTQDYLEDCEVCCRSWRVRLWYDATGAADVQLQAVD